MPNNLSGRVRLVEVGPRDGLQNERVVLPTADKLEFISRLVAAGCQTLEVASFVRPDRVPQMADAAEVISGLPTSPSVRYIALVPNRRGLERALNTGAQAIAVFTAASETFNQKNIGKSIAESLAEFRPLVAEAKAAGLWVRGYVSTAFICPYEGPIAPAQVTPVAAELLAQGVDEISIGDTIGRAEPEDVSRLTDALLPHLPLPQFAYHFHDTSGQAITNVARALTYGIAIFDASASGLGGCPFAPGAPGNLATEQLIRYLTELGIETGINPEAVAGAGHWVRERMKDNGIKS